MQVKKIPTHSSWVSPEMRISFHVLSIPEPCNGRSRSRAMTRVSQTALSPPHHTSSMMEPPRCRLSSCVIDVEVCSLILFEHQSQPWIYSFLCQARTAKNLRDECGPRSGRACLSLGRVCCSRSNTSELAAFERLRKS